MRMMWMFLVLGVSLVLAAGALLAMFLRVRRHMRASHTAEDAPSEHPDLVQQEK
jgi:uncharacterized protein YneF (UPF0154 family)